MDERFHDDQRGFAIVDPAVIVQRLFGIPLEFYYAIAIAFMIWYMLEFTAIGRRILFVGRGREVARLSGINTDRVRVGCLVASGFLGALAGVLYTGTQGAADPVSGISYQLPAFAAAFLARPASCPVGSTRGARRSRSISSSPASPDSCSSASVPSSRKCSTAARS